MLWRHFVKLMATLCGRSGDVMANQQMIQQTGNPQTNINSAFPQYQQPNIFPHPPQVPAPNFVFVFPGFSEFPYPWGNPEVESGGKFRVPTVCGLSHTARAVLYYLAVSYATPFC